MSYDLAVFKPNNEFRDRDTFMSWYDETTEWEDDLDYEQPSNATSTLQAWYRDMISVFPPMNGPDRLSTEDEEKREWTADYTIAKDIIYVAFQWPKAEIAYKHMHELAAKHGVGFFDVSGSSGEAWFPAGEGALEVVHHEQGDVDAAP